MAVLSGDSVLGMFISVYDPRRLVVLSLHAGEALTPEELDGATELLQMLSVEEVARRRPSTVLILVETENTLNASQRKRMAEAAKGLQLGYQAIVTSSPFVRAAMVAISWLKPADLAARSSVHVDYAEARAWLVTGTGHPAEVFDTLEQEARRRMAGALLAKRQTG